MEPDLIDRYLAELAGSLARTRDLADVLAEVEDHLRESADRLGAQGVDATTAQRLTLDRFGDLAVVARAYSSDAGGLVMATPFTRTAGMLAFVSAVFWLLAGLVATVGHLTDPDDVTWLYPAGLGLGVLATVSTTVVVAGMLARSGGVRSALGVVALVLMGLAVVLMVIAPWAWAFVALPVTVAVAIAVRRLSGTGLVATWAGWLLVLAWPVGVAVLVAGEALRVGPQDFYGDYPWAFLAGFVVMVICFAAGLVGIGSRLFREEALATVDRGQDAGMTIAG